MSEKQAQSIIDPAAIGVEVSWSFGNGDADSVQIARALVADALKGCGFDVDRYLPVKDPTDALKHAVRIAPKGRNVVVKEMDRKKKDTPMAFGVYVKDAQEGEGGDDWVCGARARVEANGVAAYEPEGAPGEPRCMAIARRIESDANALLNVAYNKDLSRTILEVGHDLNWISRRRNKGGVYLVQSDAEHRAEKAERYVALLKRLVDLTSGEPRGKRFQAQIIEVYPRPLSMATWAEAASDTIDDQVERLVKDLDKMRADGKMKESTMEKRADECDALLARAEEYRQFLAGKVDGIGSRLEKIRGQFRDAAAAAAAGAEGEFEKMEELAEEPAPETVVVKVPKGNAPDPVAAELREVEQMETEELFDI